MKRANGDAGRLYDATVRLGKELWVIKSSLAVYQVIGLNVKAIESGMGFLAFAQKLSLEAVVLGLAKVFEREETHELCSIRGVCRLAKQIQIQDIQAAKTYVSGYGVSPSGDWHSDVDQVFRQHQPQIRRGLRRITRVRNTQVAHVQQNAPSGALPSIAVFEDLLHFAVDFRSFVNRAFLNTHSHPILTDSQVESSLLSLLKKTGMRRPVSELKDS